jgi:hypothetical protein
MDYYDNSPSTLHRYLQKNDPCLTEYSALLIIANYLEIPDVTELVDSSHELQKQP